MNKGLEAVEETRNVLMERGFCQRVLDNLVIIEKELKALKIIKNYGYFDEQGDLIVHLPTNRKQEHELLKEVLL